MKNYQFKSSNVYLNSSNRIGEAESSSEIRPIARLILNHFKVTCKFYIKKKEKPVLEKLVS